MSVRHLLEGPVLIADYGGMNLVASVYEFRVIVPVTMSLSELLNHLVCSLVLAYALPTTTTGPVTTRSLLKGSVLPADDCGIDFFALVDEVRVIISLAMYLSEPLKYLVDCNSSF